MYSPKLFAKDRWIAPFLAISAALEGFVWWYTAANVRPAAEQVFLHYNITFGVDLVGRWWKLLFIPGGALFITLAGFLASFFLFNRDKTLARIIAVVVAFCHIFIAFATYQIVNLNL